MASKTPNLKLHKIDLTDAPPDITVLNPNWDILDAELSKTVKYDDDGKIPSDSLPPSQSITTTDKVLMVNNWTLGSDGRYYQTISVEGVTVDTELVIVDCDLTTDDADARIEILAAWAFPAANEVDQGDGKLTFYSNGIPTVSIPIFVGVA
jgi:hypothetical protein